MNGQTRQTKKKWAGGRMRIAAWIVVVLTVGGTVSVPGTAAATATSEEPPALIAQPGVVYIATIWTGWVLVDIDLGTERIVEWMGPIEVPFRCSGFVVNPNGHVVTAGHCVDPAIAQHAFVEIAVDAYFPNAGGRLRQDLIQEGLALWTVEGDRAGSEPVRDVFMVRGTAVAGMEVEEGLPARVVEVVGLDEGDVALLKVEARDLPALELATSDVTVGTEVLSIGYPGSSDLVTDATMQPTFKDGKVSSVKTRGGGMIPVYEISAAMSGGMSGGPTVDLQGRVLGLNSFAPAGESQQFNFVTPVSVIQEVLTRNGVVNELSQHDQLYREAVASFFAGKYRATIAAVDRVLDFDPRHQGAQDLRQRAVRLADTQGGGTPGALLAIAILALGAVLTGSVVIVRSRIGSRQDGTPPAAAGFVHLDELPRSRPLVAARMTPSSRNGNGTAAERAAATTHTATATLTRCVECGDDTPTGARFCPTCGNPTS